MMMMKLASSLTGKKNHCQFLNNGSLPRLSKRRNAHNSKKKKKKKKKKIRLLGKVKIHSNNNINNNTVSISNSNSLIEDVLCGE